MPEPYEGPTDMPALTRRTSASDKSQLPQNPGSIDLDEDLGGGSVGVDSSNAVAQARMTAVQSAEPVTATTDAPATDSASSVAPTSQGPGGPASLAPGGDDEEGEGGFATQKPPGEEEGTEGADGEPPGDESKMEPDMNARPPETEGGAEETAANEAGEGEAEGIEEEAAAEGEGELDAVGEQAPEEGGEAMVAETEGPTESAPPPAPPMPQGGGGTPQDPYAALGSVGGVSVDGDVSLEENGIDASTLPPEAVEMVKDVLRGMRAQNAEMAGGFLAGRQSEAATLAGMSGAITANISSAAAAARAQVQASAASQKAAIGSAVSSAIAQAQAGAAAARAQVEAELGATLAQIEAATAAGRAAMQGDKATALAQVDAAEQAQRATVEQMYAAADQKYRQAGVTVGQEAIAQGEQRARQYLSQKINRSDGFWEGHLTDNRCEARANAAREVAKAYQGGLVEEANKQAAAAMNNKQKDFDALASAAQGARTQLDQHYAAMDAQLTQSAEASKGSAQQAATALRSSVDSAESSAVSSLQAHLSSQNAALDGAAAAASAQITEQEQTAIAGLNGGLADAMTNLGDALRQVEEGLGVPQIPSPEAFAQSLGSAGEQFQANLDRAREAISGGIGSAVEGIGQTAAAADERMIGMVSEGVAMATQISGQINSQMAQLTQQAATSFQQVRDGHQQGVQATQDSAKTGAEAVVTGLNTAYAQIASQLQTGMDTNSNGLRDGLRGALTAMHAKIGDEAEKAAAKVQPRWKSVLKWVCIIVVIVVVAVVLGPLIVGAVGGVLGSGLLATVVGGAIVGGLTSAATTLISNAFDGNPLTQGLLEATLIGVVSGGAGAGLGAFASQVATKGGTVAISAVKEFAIAVSVDVVVDTTVNLLTGQLTWESFAQGLITSVLMNGAQTHPRIKGITEHFQGVGENFGQGIRTRVTGPTPTVDTTPAAAPKPSTEQAAVKLDETVGLTEPSSSPHGQTSVDETPVAPTKGSGVDESPNGPPPPEAKVNEPTVKVDEAPPAPKVDETAPAPKVEETAPAPKVEETAPAPKVEETAPAPKETAPAPKADESSPTAKTEESAPAPKVEETAPKVDEPAPKVEEPTPDTTTKVDETAPKVEETAPKVEETAPKVDETTPQENAPRTIREPSPEVKAKGEELIQKAKDAAAATTDPKVKADNEAAARKVKQILDEQAPGVTDQLKMEFMSELEARILDPANAGKDMFSMIRDTVNAASVKDANGNVVSNKYLKQGEAIPLDALQGAGPMARLYGADKVYDMLTPQAKADLGPTVTKESFGQFLANNPGYDLHGNLNPNASIEGYNDVAWWGLQSEGKAGNVTELIDALALNPEYYPNGGVRFNITPETAHGAGVTKPTAFDGMFQEWVPTDLSNPFGLTGGGKQEGVMGRVPVKEAGQIEVFGGTPEQLVTSRADNLVKSLTNDGNSEAANLVNRVRNSDAPTEVRAQALKDLAAAMKANPGDPPQKLLRDIVQNNPDYEGILQKKKTRGTAEEQVSQKGLSSPEPLTPSEVAKVREWQDLRNEYLKVARETDLDSLSPDARRLLDSRGADSAIRDHMTPDDLAGILKEQRGVVIKGKGERVFDHIDEGVSAQVAVTNRIIELQAALDRIQSGHSRMTEADRVALGQRLRALSNVLDAYERLAGL